MLLNNEHANKNIYSRQERFDGREIKLDNVGDLEQSYTIVSIVDDLLNPDLESSRYTLSNFR